MDTKANIDKIISYYSHDEMLKYELDGFRK